MPTGKKGWQKGQSGNPAGRKPGESPHAAMRKSIADKVPGIVEKMVAKAEEGDVGAARLLIERVLPPVKAAEQAVKLSLPEGGTLTAKAEALLDAAAAGELAPSQAAQLISALGSVAKITEIDELTARIQALEEKHAKK